MPEPTTSAASDTPSELQQMEQAIAEAGQTEATETTSEAEVTEEAPSAFDQLAAKKGFKSVDDLVKAYENVEGYSTKLNQDLKAIKEEIRSIKTPPVNDDPYQDLPDDQRKALSLLEQVIDKAVSKRLQPLQEDLEVRRAGSQIEAVKGQYPELNDGDINQALDIMESNPRLTLDQAVKIATFDKVRTSTQNNQKKAEQTQAKQRAFVESAKSSKTGEVDYSKLTLDELENILPIAGQFVDSKGVMRK
jgi:hypothetical protein